MKFEEAFNYVITEIQPLFQKYTDKEIGYINYKKQFRKAESKLLNVLMKKKPLKSNVITYLLEGEYLIKLLSFFKANAEVDANEVYEHPDSVQEALEFKIGSLIPILEEEYTLKFFKFSDEELEEMSKIILIREDKIIALSTGWALNNKDSEAINDTLRAYLDAIDPNDNDTFIPLLDDQTFITEALSLFTTVVEKEALSKMLSVPVSFIRKFQYKDSVIYQYETLEELPLEREELQPSLMENLDSLIENLTEEELDSLISNLHNYAQDSPSEDNSSSTDDNSTSSHTNPPNTHE